MLERTQRITADSVQAGHGAQLIGAMVRLAVFSSGSSSLGFALASHFIIGPQKHAKKNT